MYKKQKMTKTSQNQVQMVHIPQLPIELHKMLKYENIVASGGEAKFVISSGLVRVNGAVETRKSRKLVDGDIIEFEGIYLQITHTPS